MLSKRQQWVPYASLNPTVRFTFLRTGNIGVNGHPGAREDCNQTTPYDVPNRSATREVIAAISRQRAVFDSWDGASVNGETLKQVIEKE